VSHSNLKKFSSQASSDVLAALRELAATQGRQFDDVLNEALQDYVSQQIKTHPLQNINSSFASSLEEFDSLYRDLAK